MSTHVRSSIHSCFMCVSLSVFWCPFLMMPGVDLLLGIVALSSHTHLFFCCFFNVYNVLRGLAK